MVMESNQEVIFGLSPFKGKRTKRQRPVSPLGLPASSSAGESDAVTGDSRIVTPAASVDDSNNNSSGIDEEQDMANCLMLLAQGSPETSRKFSPAAVRTRPSAGDSGVYRCKTCDRSFQSFQALGGHRASHKKPNNKFGKEENSIQSERLTDEFDHQNRQFFENPMSTTLSLQISNSINYSCKANNNKIHECSICGAEFSSGQALGGHMRRHRALVSSSATAFPATPISMVSSTGRNDQPEFQEFKKPRGSLQLDLNLPAESEEENLVQESKFHYPAKEQLLAFSANSLVDCHY